MSSPVCPSVSVCTVCVFFDIFDYVDSLRVLQATTLPSRRVVILAC